MCIKLATIVIAALAACGSAFSVPPNVQKFYNDHQTKACAKPLATGFKPSVDTSDHSAEYCGDVPGVIFGHSKRGRYWDMDIDCDGANNKAGKCANDPSGQGQTAFKDQIPKVSGGALKDLNSNVHPFVVFGNEGKRPSFDPSSKGMVPLSVMAIVCNGQLFYGLWGDTNGDVNTGEASISLADLCFPKEGLSGDNGHVPEDVLYIGFTGDGTAAKGANWKAKNPMEFMQSIKAVGDKLVAKL